MKKILCFNVNDERQPFIDSWAEKHGVVVDSVSESLSMENVDLVSNYDGITVAVVGDFDSNLYPELAKRGIKQIAQRTAGYEVFDLELATKSGLIVTNVASYSPDSIAEYSVMLGLQLMRKSHLLDEKVADRDFRWLPDIRAKLVKESTVAVIGVGQIGFLVAKLYRAFGATVIGYDPYPKENVEDVLTYASTPEEAVKNADIVSIHMPAFDSNYHMFDMKLFDQMRDDAYIVNCGRGTLVNTEDLLDAIDAGKLGGAALDVYEHEAPYVPGKFEDSDIKDPLFKRLLDHPKAIFYHHCAYYTETSIRNMTQFALDATLDVINTGDTSHRVN